MALKTLNENIRKSKAKKKPAKKVTVKKQPDVVDRIVTAIEKIQAPVVNIPERTPVSYRATVELNSRGDMVAANIDPVVKLDKTGA